MNPLAVYAIALGTSITVGLLRWYGRVQRAPARKLAARPLCPPASSRSDTKRVDTGGELPEAA